MKCLKEVSGKKEKRRKRTEKEREEVKEREGGEGREGWKPGVTRSRRPRQAARELRLIPAIGQLALEVLRKRRWKERLSRHREGNWLWKELLDGLWGGGR